jgi:bifunctional non-homologous end joining protein LigD
VLPHLEPAVLAYSRHFVPRPESIYELKYDGFRSLALIDRGSVTLVSKRGFVYKRFSDLCESLGRTFPDRQLVLDGEIACLDPLGRPQFYDLMFRRGVPIYCAFDILWNGADLRSQPLMRRKKLLRKTIPLNHGRMLYVDHSEDGAGLFRLVCDSDLEGIVIKPKTSAYGDGWIKVKNSAYSQTQQRHKLFEKRG